MLKTKLISSSILLAFPIIAAAECVMPDKIFSFVAINTNNATHSNTCGSYGNNDANSFFNQLKTEGLIAIPGLNYTGSEKVEVNGNFNQVPVFMSYPNYGKEGEGTVLLLKIPELGIDQKFQGVTRNESRSLMKDYIKQSDVIGRLMKKQAANSPYSPIAGPGGLIPMLTTISFNENFVNTATNIAGPSYKSGDAAQNLIGAGIVYSSIKILDATTKVATLPLSYTIRNDIDPRRQLVISLPMTLIDTDGAKSYAGSFGVSYRLPMSDNWTITPGGRVGVVGSKALATLASAVSGSVTSVYILDLNSYDFAVGNQIGYNRTLKITSGEYSGDPKIDSITLRNGLMLSQPVTLSGQKLSMEYALVDTRYTGTKFYVDNTQELIISLGTNKHAHTARSFLRGSLRDRKSVV